MHFKKIYIEITNVCNLSCPFCSSAKRNKQFMSTKCFAHILDEIKPFCDYIYLHVLGEPLLHPDFATFLQLARQKGFYVNITSNATLLAQRFDNIKTYVRQLNMSLHADLNGQFPHYLKDCLSYGDRLAESGVFISYRFWNQKQQRLDIHSQQMLREIAAHYAVSVRSQKKQKLAERRFLHMEEPFTWPSLSQPLIGYSGTCYGLRHQCAILCDGSVVPCCLDAQGSCRLGNIFQESFGDILNKDLTKAVRSGFQQGKAVAPLCQHCSYRLRFD